MIATIQTLHSAAAAMLPHSAELAGLLVSLAYSAAALRSARLILGGAR